jgi:amino acid adenylation domain-containing protein
MVFSFHHLLLDGWSMPLLLGELLRLYEALRIGERLALPPALPFRDYVDWLSRADAASPGATEAFWRRELAGFAAPTPLPLERRPDRAPEASGATGTTHRSIELTAGETGALQRLARRGHVTLGTLVQGAWAILLARHAATGDVLFGATSSGRPAELPGAEGMLGLFIVTLPVRVAVDAARPLLPWLDDLQQHLARLRDLEHCPLAEIQRWSDVPRGTALFGSLVVFEDGPVDLGTGATPDASENSLRIGGLQALQSTPYPLTLVGALHGGALLLRLELDGNRYTAPPVLRALSQLAALLRSMGDSTEDGPPLGSLPLLGAAERQQLLHEWNDTDRAPAAGPLLHRLFEQRAAATPAATALLLDGQALSYGEVEARASRLAAALRRRGAGPETLVAIALHRSVWLPVAMLAVWKAGGAFLPLDPSYPGERLAFMLADSGAGWVISDGLAHGSRTLFIDELLAEPADPADPADSSDPADPPLNALAYVIYTSGSTGTPKGVMIEHRGLANLVREQIEVFGITPQSRVLQLASASFDASVSEIWTAWIAGATLVMLPEGSVTAEASLLRRLDENAVSVATFPPSLLAALPHGELPALTTLVLAGEAANEALLARWAPGRSRLLNAYGPTEITVCATMETLEPERAGGEPLLGRPMANTRVRLLDDRQQPVAIGAVGEICLAGAGLARGYLARPDLTAASFLPDSWSPDPGGRLYRTGDLARWTADGKLAFLGRRDEQVKVRGVRIETGEVEAALARHPDVGACAVVARRDGLVAYFVANQPSPGAPLAARLRSFLQLSLPDSMLPGRFVELPELPRTLSGKLDRRAAALGAAAQRSRTLPGRRLVGDPGSHRDRRR